MKTPNLQLQRSFSLFARTQYNISGVFNHRKFRENTLYSAILDFINNFPLPNRTDTIPTMGGAA